MGLMLTEVEKGNIRINANILRARSKEHTVLNDSWVALIIRLCDEHTIMREKLNRRGYKEITRYRIIPFR